MVGAAAAVAAVVVDTTILPATTKSVQRLLSFKRSRHVSGGFFFLI